MNENKTRDAILKGELNRDKYDEEEAYQFLKFLKIPKRLTPDEEDCIQASV